MQKRFYLGAVLSVLLFYGHEASAQAPVFYNMSVYVPNTTIDADVFSARIIHTVGYSGSSTKTIFFTVTPAGATSLTLTGIDLGDVQSFDTALNQAMTLLNDDGQLITEGGQSNSMQLSALAIPRQGSFALVPVGPTAVYEVQIYNPNVKPYFYRNYSLTSLQAFVSYLNLCVAFANALP